MLKQSVIVGCVIFGFCIMKISGTCTISLTDPTPLTNIQIGSKTLLLSRGKRSISLNQGESVTFYCPTTMSFYSNNYGDVRTPSTTFKCSSTNGYSQIYIESKQQLYSSTVSNLKCDSSAAVIGQFESSNNLPNCENYVSYVFGQKGLPKSITMGICFDLYKLQPIYITYLGRKLSVDVINDEKNLESLGNLLNLTADLKVPALENYLNFMSLTTFDAAYKEKREKSAWLRNIDYVYDKLYGNVMKESNAFNSMFNVMWWNSLFRGNWALFNDMLLERFRDNHYLTFVGTHGSLELPALTACSNKEVISVESGAQRVDAFEYVWTYVKSLNSSISEEFVVVGYNSPYLTMDNMKEKMFCKDICADIEWLKNDAVFSTSRLMPSMGLVFCCSPQEAAEKFSNFPWKVEKRAPEDLPTTPSPRVLPEYNWNLEREDEDE